VRNGTLDGNALRTERTRNRVLAESLRLFNERGEARVTTGLIATSLAMSPGNLYYHFRNKEAIVEALFERFAARMEVEPGAAPDAASAIEDLWLYLHLMLEAIWEFRFLYRNLDDLVSRNRALRTRFNSLADRKHAVVVQLCDSLAALGAMHASAEEIAALAKNVLVVATYWLNFRALRGRPPSASGAEVGQGAYQVMCLVAPYLRGEARKHLDGLAAMYR
jgi:AcrR family transcriptional regulator